MDNDSVASPKAGRALSLSPNYTEKDWNDAFNGREEWKIAINIVEDRIKGRWLEAADRLVDEPRPGFGFAILALDCIALEALWGFMNGKAVPRRHEKQVYQEILTGPRFGLAADLSESFREMVRNGIMHDAETRSRWLVERTIPRDTIARKNNSGDYEINRTKFHEALKGAFEDWLAKLRSGHASSRDNMRNRMEQIIAKHYDSSAATRQPNGSVKRASRT